MTRKLAITLLALSSLPAHADPRQDKIMVLAKFADEARQIQTNHLAWKKPVAIDVAPCNAAAAQLARDKPDDKLYDQGFEHVGGAKDPKSTWFVVARDAGQICARYASLAKLIDVARLLRESRQMMSNLERVKPSEVGDAFGAQSVAAAEKCLAGVDKAIKDGATDVPLKVDTDMLTVAQARAKVCEAFLAKARTFNGAADAQRKEAYEKAAAPLRQLGVKGERLDLFVKYNDTPFYAPGCTTEILDNKVLVRMPRVFHWLDGSDGEITIRTYAFAGDKVTTSERTYGRKADAYAGCR